MAGKAPLTILASLLGVGKPLLGRPRIGTKSWSRPSRRSRHARQPLVRRRPLAERRRLARDIAPRVPASSDGTATACRSPRGRGKPARGPVLAEEVCVSVAGMDNYLRTLGRARSGTADKGAERMSAKTPRSAFRRHRRRLRRRRTRAARRLRRAAAPGLDDDPHGLPGFASAGGSMPCARSRSGRLTCSTRVASMPSRSRRSLPRQRYPPLRCTAHRNRGRAPRRRRVRQLDQEAVEEILDVNDPVGSLLQVVLKYEAAPERAPGHTAGPADREKPVAPGAVFLPGAVAAMAACAALDRASRRIAPLTVTGGGMTQTRHAWQQTPSCSATSAHWNSGT